MQINLRAGPDLAVTEFPGDIVEESATLPDPDLPAQEIADDLQNALAPFATIAGKLTKSLPRR